MAPRHSLKSPDGTMVMKVLTRRVAKFFVVVAITCSVVLLTKDCGIKLPGRISQTSTAAASLLLVGGALLIAQTLIHPETMELIRNVLLSVAFIMWGLVQLLPLTALSEKLGDMVVALFVVDVAWTTLAIIKHHTQPQT
jgi:hypothetical protein